MMKLVNKNNTNAINDFTSDLKSNVVKFTYIKKDGTERSAIGTMLPEYLPEKKQTDPTKPVRKVPEHLCFYFDIEANGFRSFVKDNLIDWKIDKNN